MGRKDWREVYRRDKKGVWRIERKSVSQGEFCFSS